MSDRYLRDRLGDHVARYGLDAVRKALAELEDPERPETPNAIRAHLLADLATWPAPFQHKLRELVERMTEAVYARLELQRFEQQRARGTGEADAYRWGGGCGCGCRGINSELGRYLHAIRDAAREMRAAPTARKKRNRRESLSDRKAAFLHWLWGTGQRRIDRLALGQHAVEAAKREQEQFAGYIKHRGFAIREAGKRLDLGVYQKGPRKGQPLEERHRLNAAATLKDGRAAVQSYQARIRELERLIAEDVPTLVRRYAGCARGEVA